MLYYAVRFVIHTRSSLLEKQSALNMESKDFLLICFDN